MAATQYGLPGVSGDFNETAASQKAVPGVAGDLNDTVPSVFNLSVTESGAATDSPSEHFIANPSVAETGAATATTNAVKTDADGLTEFATATSTQSATITYHPSVAETANAASTQGELLRLNRSVTEAATAASTQSDSLVVHRTISEAAAVTDHPGIIFNMSVNETMVATDHTNRSKVINVGISEAGHARDSDLSGINLSVDEDMHAETLLSESTNGHFPMRVREHLAADDTVSVSHFNLHVAETLHPLTLISAGKNGVYDVSIHTVANAQDHPTSNIKTHSIVHETLAPSDHIGVEKGVPGVWNLSVAEAANAVDSSTDPETFTNPGIYFWGYQWAYGVYPTLAVWLAGLDCGDHPINPNGSVFVPFLSDPDGFLTPAYLMNLSNNPPAGGFGASACNIDLTPNSGNMIRIVVDLAIGVPYTSIVQLLRPNSPELSHSTFGPSLGETRRLHQYGAQLVNAQGLSVGTRSDNLRPMTFLRPKGTKYFISRLFTGVHWDVIEDDYDFEGMIMVQVDRPYPATIAALSGFFKTFDRG
jgi:hypothetical protein